MSPHYPPHDLAARDGDSASLAQSLLDVGNGGVGVGVGVGVGLDAPSGSLSLDQEDDDGEVGVIMVM